MDAEVIELGWRFTQALGLQGLSLAINSIGDPACRPQYLDALKEHYTSSMDRACPDCRVRFQRNPLRMLDCKRRDFACQELIAAAPQMVDCLCDACAAHFAQVRRYLDALEIPYRVSPTLVRGLDYYSRTVFEIHPPEEGSQSALLAGGRYDGLIELLGGRPTPGIGFGSGIERFILNVKRQEAASQPGGAGVDAVVVILGDAAAAAGVKLASDLRRQGLEAVLAPQGRSLRGQLRHATALNATYALVLGDDELAHGVVQVKELASGEQRPVQIDALRVVDGKLV